MKFIFNDFNNNLKPNILKSVEEEMWAQTIKDNKQIENDINNLFIDATNNLQNDINMSQVKEGLQNQDTSKIEDAIPFDSFVSYMEGIGPFLIGAYLFGSKNGKANSPNQIKNLDFNINIQDERTLKWIKEKTGDLIKQITDETKLAVREIINRAYTKGLGVDVAANHIKNIVGLTTRQSMAVDNYMNRLINEGVSAKDAQMKANKYAVRLREFRAETIARTESMKAMNEGYMGFVDEIINRGLINGNEYIKVWWTAKDERVCPVCGPMHGVKVKPLEPFHTSAGETMGGNAHINCRCNFFIEKI